MTGANGQGHSEVAGYCPACGSAGLFAGAGGRITCGLIGCPDPTAVDRVLSDPLNRFHVVTFGEESFGIQHPLTERGNDLTVCELHQAILAMSGPPVRPGRYIAEKPGGVWTWREAGQ